MLKRKSSKSKAAAAEEREAQKILPKFLNFLETDLWNLPIKQFVEQNSVVFDREQGDPETYSSVHQSYARLVDTLIDSYCRDANIVSEKLINALKALTKTPAPSYKEKVLLEPIIASQDFNVFVPMMMRKNVELQLQALKMIEHLHDLPTSLKLDEEDEELWNILFDEDESERLILISVLKESKAEWERDQRLSEAEWQRQLEEAKKNSLMERELLILMRDEAQKHLENALQMNNCFDNMVIGDNSNTNEPSTLQTSLTNISSKTQLDLKHTHTDVCVLTENGNEIKKEIINEKNDVKEVVDKFQYRNLLKEKSNAIPEEQIRQRSEYLREQRDKLLAKKFKERERQFNFTSNAVTTERPTTARVARNAMSEIEARRAIAAKIKANLRSRRGGRGSRRSARYDDSNVFHVNEENVFDVDVEREFVEIL